jgi:hypothetical protein
VSVDYAVSGEQMKRDTGKKENSLGRVTPAESSTPLVLLHPLFVEFLGNLSRNCSSKIVKYALLILYFCPF